MINKFNNLKIRTKLIYAFSVISVVTLLTGVLGVLNINNSSKALHEIDKVRVPSILYLKEMQYSLANIAIGLRGLLINEYSGDVKKAQYLWIDKQRQLMEISKNKYLPLAMTETEKKIWEILAPLLKKSKSNLDTIVELSREKDFHILNGNKEKTKVLQKKIIEASYESRIIYLEVSDLFEKIIIENTSEADKFYRNTQNFANQSLIFLILFVVFSLTLALGFGHFIGSHITKRIRRVLNATMHLNKGHVHYRTGIKGKDEIALMAQNLDAFVKKLNGFSKVLDRISKGKIDVTFPILDKEDKLGPALNKIAYRLKRLFVDDMVLESKRFKRAAELGKLDWRGNSQKYEGGYKLIIENFNSTLDIIVKNYNQGVETLSQLASGRITAEMKGDYEGHYKILQEKINKVGGLLRSIFIKMKNAVSISIRHTTGKKPGAEEGSKNRIIRTRKVGKAEIDYKNN